MPANGFWKEERFRVRRVRTVCTARRKRKQSFLLRKIKNFLFLLRTLLRTLQTLLPPHGILPLPLPFRNRRLRPAVLFFDVPFGIVGDLSVAHARCEV